jgi:sugar-phosphatase
VNGLVSAKAARMRVIAVPEASQLEDRRFCLADAVVRSLLDIDGRLLERLS